MDNVVGNALGPRAFPHVTNIKGHKGECGLIRSKPYVQGYYNDKLPNKSGTQEDE